MKIQGDVVVFGQDLTFFTFQIGIENEALEIKVLQQNHTRRRPTIFRGGRQIHRIGVVRFAFFRFIEPRCEQLKRFFKVYHVVIRDNRH